MDKKHQETALSSWLLTRSESVQQLAREFPIGNGISFVVKGRRFFLLGYTEDDSLIISRVNPARNYQLATKRQEFLEACHLRDGSVQIVKRGSSLKKC